MHNYPYFRRKVKLHKVGILVKDLRPSTMSYTLIETGNKIAKDHLDIDFYVFNQDWHIPSNSICFPLLQQKNAWGFDGTLISTDIDTTLKLLNIPTSKKFFYIWDMYEHIKVFDSAKRSLELFRNTDLTLVARCIEYSSILQRNFNRNDVAIVKDFNYDDLLQLIGYRKN